MTRATSPKLQPAAPPATELTLARQPDAPRPYRAPFQPWSLWLALLLNLALLGVFVAQDPWNALLGFALVGLLSAAYLLFARAADPHAPSADEIGDADAWKMPN